MLKSVSRAIGVTTNNQAEYTAIIVALEHAIKLGAKQVELNSDSELVVFQLTGRYRVKKDTLKPLFQQVKELCARFESFKVKHIPASKTVKPLPWRISVSVGLIDFELFLLLR